MSMTGDPIVAYPDTITGSIGVLYVRPVLRGLYDKLGIQEDILTRGKLAGMDSESVPLSDAAKEKLHEMIQTTYQQFVSKVAGARRKSYDQIDQLAQGRVWMGEQALGNGLIDNLGGLDQAIALVRKKANLSPTGATNLVLYPPRKTLFELLTQSSPQAVEDEAAESKIRKALPALPSAAFLRGGTLRILPYRLLIH